MNFFRVLGLLCSGTSSMLKLFHTPVWRVLLHSALLILICTLFISCINLYLSNSHVERVVSSFFDRTGNIEISESQILLTKHPEEVRRYVLVDKNVHFAYFPDGKNVDLSFMTDLPERQGIICLPSGFFVWMRDEFHRGIIFSMMPAETLFKIMTASDLRNFYPEIKLFLDKFTGKNTVAVSVKTLEQEIIRFVSAFDAAAGQPGSAAQKNKVILTCGSTISSVLCMLFGMNFSRVISEMLFIVFVSGFILSYVQYLRYYGISKHLITLKCSTAITFYSMFPPMLIASLFEAFQLPFMSFSMVFFMTFVVYMSFAFGAIMKTIYPPKEKDYLS